MMMNMKKNLHPIEVDSMIKMKMKMKMRMKVIDIITTIIIVVIINDQDVIHHQLPLHLPQNLL